MKNKKSVLFITPFLPLNNSGDSFVSLGVINGLLERDYSIKIASFKESKKHISKLKKSNISYISKYWNYQDFSFFKKLSLFFSVSPFFSRKFFDHDFLKKIQKEIKKNNFDEIIIHGYAMAQYSIFLDSGSITYLEDEDMGKIFKARFLIEQNLFKKVFLFTEYIKSFFYQRIFFTKFTKLWLLNEKNKNSYLSKNSKKIKIPLLAEKKTNFFKPSSKDIVFTGTLNWDENKEGLSWFLKNIWPQVVEQNKKTKLHVVGKNIENDLQKLINISTNVIAHGFVENLEEVYKNSAFAIAPIWVNAGVKIKILSYLQHGLPVIASLESTEGLFSSNGIILSDKSSFLGKTNLLLKNRNKRENLSKKAIENIRENYSMRNITRFLKDNL